MRWFDFSLSMLVLIGIVLCPPVSAAPSGITRFEVTPTVLCIRKNGTLKQVLHVSVENTGKPAEGRISARIAGRSESFRLERIGKGAGVYPIEITEVSAATRAEFTLRAGSDTRTCTVTIDPPRKWTIYLFHHSHSDIGYTELQTRVALNHAAYLDSVISYCSQTDGYPDDAKFRWNVEVTWSIEQFLRERPEARIRELMDLVKAGRVEIGAWYLQMSDMFSHEEIIRNLYFARELSRRYDIEVVSAMNNDVNGFAWGCPQVLGKAGIRYFATGINETRSRAPLNRPCAFWWESPDGSRILHWNGEHYLFANYALLVHERCDASAPKVSEYLIGLQRREDYPYDIIAMNVSAWVTDNCPPGRRLSDIVREWNSRWEYPKLRLATMREFFETFEKRYGDRIPTYRLGWPDYWTDGVASTAYETGLNRITHSELVSAEKLSAAAAALDPGFVYPAGELDKTCRLSMLYDEHTWGAYNSISEPWSELARSQWTVKSGFAYVAREQSRHLLGSALQAVAARIPSAGQYTLAVMNPLSWMRSDVVRVSLPQALVDTKGAFILNDRRTGERVPFQLTGDREILFFARDIPSLGYAVYTTVPDSAAIPQKAEKKTASGVLENRFYRVTLDPVTGGIKSIMDKEMNAELVDTGAHYTLNQYVYETPDGGRAAVDNMNQPARFVRSSPSAATFTSGLDGPAAVSVIAKTSAKPCPSIDQEVILYDGVKRIDIVNTLVKNETLDPEALYYAFPFAGKDPELRMEVADAVMMPEKEQLPKTTRDWMAVQHWVEAAASGRTVVWAPVEAPLVEYCDINTGKWLTLLPVTNSHLFSYAMNNYWMTNFKAAQGGMFTFRYSVTSRPGGSDLTASSRFGWEIHTPLAAVWIPENTAGTLPPNSYGFLAVDSQNVIVQAFKRAEDGNGYIVRLREIAGKDTDVSLSMPLFDVGAMSAVRTDMAERDLDPCRVTGNAVTLHLNGFGIETVRVVRRHLHTR